MGCGCGCGELLLYECMYLMYGGWVGRVQGARERVGWRGKEGGAHCTWYLCISSAQCNRHAGLYGARGGHQRKIVWALFKAHQVYTFCAKRILLQPAVGPGSFYCDMDNVFFAPYDCALCVGQMAHNRLGLCRKNSRRRTYCIGFQGGVL